MGIYKRGDTFWIDINFNNKRIRRTAGTGDRKAAQELHDQLKADLWRQSRLGEKPKRTFEEAAVRWLKEKSHKRSISDDAQRIVFWRQHCAGMTLNQITRNFVAEHLDNFKTRFDRPATAGTKNRYVALLRAILRAAEREWEWIDRAPAFRVYAEPKRRVSFFTPEQAKAFMAVLPERYQAPVAFAFMTGLRRSNIFGLRWDQVDLVRNVCWVHADQAKAGENIVVPLNTDARALLEQLKEARIQGQELVFGTDWRIPTKTWRSLLKKANLPLTLRFHDIRHSFASWHLMAGTDKKVVQELGGWKSPQMLERYIHLSPEHLQHAQERLTGKLLGWSMGLEPTTAGITIQSSTN